MPEIEGMEFPDAKVIPAYIELVEEVRTANLLGQKARPVKTDADLSTVVEILTKVEFVVRRADTLRKDMGRPYRGMADYLSKEVNELVSPLLAITERLGGEVSGYQREKQEAIDKERRKQERLAAKRQERENKRAEKEERDPIVMGAPEIADVPKTIETESGASITTKNIRKYRVLDFEKLPDRFKEEAKGELNKAAKGGEEDIPGVLEFYYDDGTQFNFG